MPEGAVFSIETALYMSFIQAVFELKSLCFFVFRG